MSASRPQRSEDTGVFFSSPRGLPMSRINRIRTLLSLILVLFAPSLVKPSTAQTSYPALPSETPASFQTVTDSFEYVRRVVMIPMRDGVKLHTVILIPKNAKDAPILLTRTPYNADDLTSHDPRGGE